MYVYTNRHTYVSILLPQLYARKTETHFKRDSYYHAMAWQWQGMSHQHHFNLFCHKGEDTPFVVCVERHKQKKGNIFNEKKKKKRKQQQPGIQVANSK